MISFQAVFSCWILNLHACRGRSDLSPETSVTTLVIYPGQNVYMYLWKLLLYMYVINSGAYSPVT